MSEHRSFARFRATPDLRRGTFPVPPDGLCLSAFLLARPAEGSDQVLMGRMDPAGPWEEAAAMDAERARAIGDRWVLPASQLAFFESPSDAARRIAREMLGWREPPLGEPQVFSEAYPRDSGSQDPHWDLHFLFRTVWPGTSLTAARGRLWKELRFVRPVELSSAEFGRGHGDVLALAGLPPRGPPSG